MDNLKTCPFCGGEAYYSYNDGSWYVACFDCGSKEFESMAFGYPPSNMKERRDEAIKRWNRRVFEPKTAVWKQAGTKTIECSRCSFGITFAEKSLYKYCPYCGSKMEYENGIEA